MQKVSINYSFNIEWIDLNRLFFILFFQSQAKLVQKRFPTYNNLKQQEQFNSPVAVPDPPIYLNSYLPPAIQLLTYFAELLQYETLHTTTIEPPWHGELINADTSQNPLYTTTTQSTTRFTRSTTTKRPTTTLTTKYPTHPTTTTNIPTHSTTSTWWTQPTTTTQRPTTTTKSTTKYPTTQSTWPTWTSKKTTTRKTTWPS